MIFKIHNDKLDDFIIIKGEDDIEIIRERVKKEMNKRGWKEEDCWSEPIG